MATLRRVFTVKNGKRMQSKKWYAQYRDSTGKVVRKPLSPNKTLAMRMLAEIMEREERKRAGFHEDADDHAGTPIEDHLEAYRQSFADRGHTDRQAREVTARCQSACTGCKFRALPDLRADKLAAWLTRNRELGTRQAGGFGTQTSNHYLAAMKAFAAWCVRTNRLQANPFASTQKLNVETDLRRNRRAFTDEEVAYLLEHTANDIDYREMSGADRCVVYKIALYTGLRAGEIWSLNRDSFYLDSTAHHIIVEAGYSKRRRKDRIPIHPALLEVLKPWLQNRKAKHLWPARWINFDCSARSIGGDMRRARASWIKAGGDPESSFLRKRDQHGNDLDFHSLRHTFITRLVASGVAPAIAQKLARHSTIALTMNRYTHLSEAETDAGLRSMPAIGKRKESDRFF
jgi:integrase